LPIRIKKIGDKYHVLYETVKKLGVFNSEQEALDYVKDVKEASRAKVEKWHG
jgi:hypothetical protein